MRSWQRWRDHYQDRLTEQAIGGKATSPLRGAYEHPPSDVSSTSLSVYPAVAAANRLNGFGGDGR